MRQLLPIAGGSALVLAALLGAQGPGPAPEPVAERVLGALVYGGGCSSEIELRNLGERAVTVEVEGHRESGALVGIAGLAGMAVRLGPHERGIYRLEIREETAGAWVKVRERGPPGASPSVAVSATGECLEGDRLRSVRRDVAFPQNNPWFDSGASGLTGGKVALINTAPASALARLCYSAGNLYSVPGRGMRPGELVPVCSLAFEVAIPPYGSREFPVEREGSTHFSLHTLGRGIVLEMLRPVDAHIRVYRVDSTIRFDGEPSDRAGR